MCDHQLFKHTPPSPAHEKHTIHHLMCAFWDVGAIVGVTVILGITMAWRQQPVFPLTHTEGSTCMRAMRGTTMPLGFAIRLKFCFQRQGSYMEDNHRGYKYSAQVFRRLFAICCSGYQGVDLLCESKYERLKSENGGKHDSDD